MLIEGNDIYLEPDRYIGATNTPTGRERHRPEGGVAQTVFDGHHEQSPLGLPAQREAATAGRDAKKPTALGEALVVQRFCRNAVVRGNIFADSPRAMKDENWKQSKGFPSIPPAPGMCCSVANQFCDIRDRATGRRGAIIKPITARLAFYGNHFARSRLSRGHHPAELPAARDPVFEGNTLVGVDSRQRPRNKPSGEDLPFDTALNASAAATQRIRPVRTRAWTGPEWGEQQERSLGPRRGPPQPSSCRSRDAPALGRARDLRVQLGLHSHGKTGEPLHGVEARDC